MKAALYIRVSTERQAEEGFSMEAQHDILMSLVEKKGLHLYKVYSDPGVSGGSFKRPGIQMLLKDMQDKKFDTVIVHKLDRLSRNQGDLYNFINLINKLDIRFIIAAQGEQEIDTTSPMGKAFLMFSGIWAEIYLDNLREEVLKGLVTKAKDGGRHMSRPSLGYTYNSDHELVIVEEEANLLREAARMILSGAGRNKTAAHMNAFSRMKEGGKWDAKAVKTVLLNPTNAGFNHFKPKDWPEEQRIIIKGSHDPIFSLEEYEQLKKVFDRRKKGQMSNNSYDYAYSGILKCSRCGANFNGNSRKHALVDGSKVYKGYRCHNQYLFKTCDQPSIAENILNQLVFDHIMITGTTVAEKKQKKKEVIDAQKEIEVSNRRKKNWMMALGDGKLSPSDYADLVDEEEKRINDILARVQHEETYEPEIPPEELIHMIVNLKEHWELLEDDTQKQLIQSMFRKIVVDKKENGWQVVDLLTV